MKALKLSILPIFMLFIGHAFASSSQPWIFASNLLPTTYFYYVQFKYQVCDADKNCLATINTSRKILPNESAKIFYNTSNANEYNMVNIIEATAYIGGNPYFSGIFNDNCQVLSGQTVNFVESTDDYSTISCEIENSD